jgi:regulator of RNase E activity RraA
MMKRALGCVALCGWLVAGTGALQAHHSLAGVYDMKTDKEVAGTVTTVKFTNPHGSLAVAVKNPDGSTTEWVMTLGSATALAQKGVGKTGPNALHTGDAITVKFLPAKDGSPLGFLKSVTYPDGHVIQISAGNAND